MTGLVNDMLARAGFRYHEEYDRGFQACTIVPFNPP